MIMADDSDTVCVSYIKSLILLYCQDIINISMHHKNHFGISLYIHKNMLKMNGSHIIRWTRSKTSYHHPHLKYKVNIHIYGGNTKWNHHWRFAITLIYAYALLWLYSTILCYPEEWKNLIGYIRIWYYREILRFFLWNQGVSEYYRKYSSRSRERKHVNHDMIWYEQ